MKKKLLNALIATAALMMAPIFASAQSSHPILVDGETPEFTKEARAMGVQGVVIVEALVDETGRVVTAEVVKSLHPSLDQATLNAVKTWKFDPAMVDGRAVMKVVRIPVAFRLVDPSQEAVQLGTIANYLMN